MKSSELVRLLKKDGWFVVRQTGSHLIMEQPVKNGQIVCPIMAAMKSVKGWKRRLKKMLVSNKIVCYEN